MLSDTGSTFKCSVVHDPYFFVLPRLRGLGGVAPGGAFSEGGGGGSAARSEDESVYHESLTSALLRRYESRGLRMAETVRMEDLDEPNHLGEGKDGRAMIKLVFDNVQQLMEVRRDVLEKVKENKKRDEEVRGFVGTGAKRCTDHCRRPLASFSLFLQAGSDIIVSLVRNGLFTFAPICTLIRAHTHPAPALLPTVCYF